MAAAAIDRREGNGASGLAALAVVASGLAIAAAQTSVRILEASLSAGLVRGLGIVPAEAFGSAVVFPLDGRNVGFTITAGCSVAFLLPVFFVAAAALVFVGRIGLPRAAATVTLVSALVFAVNQVRLLIVAASMRGWGFETGYERSHILLGSLASTIGIVGGVLVFLYMVTRPTGAGNDHG